jgi:hypothetical protein
MSGNSTAPSQGAGRGLAMTCARPGAERQVPGVPLLRIHIGQCQDAISAVRGMA